MNRKYRYYQCSNARPYENSNKLCKARYIRADDLEGTVWSKTKEVFSDPSIILDDIQRQLVEAGDNKNTEVIDAEIKKLKINLRQLDQRRSNLLEAMELGEFDKDEILDRLGNLKRMRQDEDKKLIELLDTRASLTSLADAKLQIDQLYEQVLKNLDNCTMDVKRLAMDALDIKVYASTDSIEIKGVIPLELPTTAQTSGCLSSQAYKYLIPFAFSIK